MDRLKTCVDRLNKCRFLERYLVRQPDHAAFCDPRHHSDIFRKTAPVRIETRSETDFLVLRTLRMQVPVTVKAIAAWYVMKTADSIANCPLLDTRTDVYDGTCEFVAENLGRPNQPMLNLFHIGSANTTGGNLNEDFPLGNFRHRDVLHHDRPRTAINARSHAPLFSMPVVLTKCVSCVRHSRYLSKKSASFRAALELSNPNRINLGRL